MLNITDPTAIHVDPPGQMKQRDLWFEFRSFVNSVDILGAALLPHVLYPWQVAAAARLPAALRHNFNLPIFHRLLIYKFSYLKVQADVYLSVEVKFNNQFLQTML